MWTRIALFIIKNRLSLIIFLALVTGFMAYKAKDVEMTYDFAKVISPEDPDMLYFERFRKTFGEDGNVLVVGMQDSNVYDITNFSKLNKLSEDLKNVEGVNGVISLTEIVHLVKDTVNRKLVPQPIFKDVPQTQEELDSLLALVNDLKFYRGQVINPETGANLIALTIDGGYLNSSKRQEVLEKILAHSRDFTKETGVKLHFAGLPYVRSTMTTKVAGEMKMFLILALVVTGVTLFIFFRSFYAVIFPLLVVGVIVIWCLGSIVLLGYKITLLTGLIPSIIVVIGIPNSTYLLARYHYDYRQSGNKLLSLTRVIKKIGLVTLINNTTTAIGFIVFCFTNIAILFEFGLIAGINIFSAFFISMILIPAVFSFLPAPTERQLRHLDAKPLNKLLEFFDFIVHKKRGLVYAFAIVILGLSFVGISKVKTVSFMVDDLPAESNVNSDLAFFERHFRGVMPLEILVDTNKKNGVLKLKNLRKIDAFESYLRTQPVLSAPISIVSFLKASTQAFYNENPSEYRLPDNSEKNFIFSYLQGGGENSRLLRAFVDSTNQVARISLKVADIGSRELDTLMTEKIWPKINEVFGGTEMKVTVTGTTLLFIKGNEYLINNLRSSLILAFALVSLTIALLFRSFRTVVISLIPNMVPLIIAGGIMGLFNIPLKPSTALIFSIALGIAVDNSIHFLAKYRQELFSNGFNVSDAISTSLREAGTSMIYTSIVLLVGFVIFVWSEFGGTKALGMLMSVSLLIAMFTNLILLPCLLMTLDNGSAKRDKNALIEDYEEYYLEESDEEINLDKIENHKQS